MINDLLLPILILFVFLYATFKKNDSYHSFLEGAKDGLLLFINIFPTMLAMSFAIHLLRSSNILTLTSNFIGKLLPFIPNAIVPLALFRPFSGSATLALLVDIFANIGVDSYTGIMASIIQG
ncbi:MAG: spore maturation protein, partial [Erysipelotrichia bacterium]|nr:spore maturation protein [Erysipelotrichia bacterium]